MIGAVNMCLFFYAIKWVAIDVGDVSKTKVIAICNYNDLELKRLVEKDEILTTTQERAEILINRHVCLPYNDITETANLKANVETATKKMAKRNVTKR